MEGPDRDGPDRRRDTTEMLIEAATAEKTPATSGAGGSADELVQAVYDELHEIAESYLQRERPDHILQPTVLVHEAYMRLVDQSRVDWRGRTHFKAVAAEAMKRALVDHARSRDRQKRGGGWRRVQLDDALLSGPGGAPDLVEVHELLTRLRSLDERQAAVAEMRLLGGLGNPEISHLLDVSLRTVEREWMMGQAWLRRELDRGHDR